MTDDRLPSPAGKPNFIKKISPWLLVVPSAIVGVLLVELFCRLFIPAIGSAGGANKGYDRVIFFDGRSTIFEIREDIFTYVPDNEIRNLTGFLSEGDFSIEYDYRFHTNNFGLVQDADILPERDSLLLMGDSFTEGVGAEPWFRLVSPEIDKLGFQAVNGGLLGTGFEQWLKLARYLESKNIRIRKLIVLFISDDYHRPLMNFSPGVLRCLSALPLCHLEESFLYRLPPREELPAWITKIRTARGPATNWLKARAATLLPASYQVYKYFSDRLRNAASIARLRRAEQESPAAIVELIRMYDSDNVAFIHLPQKDEIANGPDRLGLEARGSIREAGGRLFDGFKLCGLTAQDYYSNDDHPNPAGYAKIASCVANVIKEVARPAQ